MPPVNASQEPLCALIPEELAQRLSDLNQPAYRARQLFSWIHKRGHVDPSAMTNLPQSFRQAVERLGASFPARVGDVLESSDGTRKLEITLEDGRAVETVLIPEGGKLTQCISSQVGCAARCRFCRSGHAGLVRNLSAAEILAQVQLARPFYSPGQALRNIVFMGIGEPLHNVEQVARAARILAHPDGLDLSTRRITVSTVGIVKGIDRLGALMEGDIALAVSLHAADAPTRKLLVPGIKETPQEIVEALRRYPLASRRRFTIEYVLIAGINDTDQHARELVRLLSRLKVKINLLPLNPHDKTELCPPSSDRVQSFQKILQDKGLTAIVRKRRGADIGAACGQLLGLGRKANGI
jgi:23S rRNA (adenine2503-C2)-methyltransferase